MAAWCSAAAARSDRRIRRSRSTGWRRTWRQPSRNSAASRIDYRWSGLVAMTMDQLPHVGRAGGRCVLRRRLQRHRGRDGEPAGPAPCGADARRSAGARRDRPAARSRFRCRLSRRRWSSSSPPGISSWTRSADDPPRHHRNRQPRRYAAARSGHPCARDRPDRGEPRSSATWQRCGARSPVLRTRRRKTWRERPISSCSVFRREAYLGLGERIAPHLGPGAIVISVTNTVPLAAIAERVRVPGGEGDPHARPRRRARRLAARRRPECASRSHGCRAPRLRPLQHADADRRARRPRGIQCRRIGDRAVRCALRRVRRRQRGARANPRAHNARRDDGRNRGSGRGARAGRPRVGATSCARRRPLAG